MTAWLRMSVSQNDAGDIIYFVLCFLLTFAVVFVVFKILLILFPHVMQKVFLRVETFGNIAIFYVFYLPSFVDFLFVE